MSGSSSPRTIGWIAFGLVVVLGCPSSPVTPESEPPTAAPVAGDSIVALDLLSHPDVTELVDLEVLSRDAAPGGRRLVIACSSSVGVNLVDAGDPAELQLQANVTTQVLRCDHAAYDPSSERLALSSHSTVSVSAPVLAVLDVSDPQAPVSLDMRPIAFQPEGLEFLADGTLVVAAHGDGLVLMDLSAVSGQPIERARIDGMDNASKVRVLDADHLAVADGASGLRIVSLSAAAVVATLPLPGAARDLDVRGDRMAVALGAGGVAWIDVSDPTAPALLDLRETPGSVTAVAVQDGRVAISDWWDLRVFDTSGDVLTRIGREPLPFGVRPPPVLVGLRSRSLGLATDGDLLFSANWTELASFEVRPGLLAPDLVLDPPTARLPRSDEPSVLLRLENVGSATALIDEVRVDANGWTAQADAGALEPGGNLAVLVSAAPDGPRSAVINVVSDDPDEPVLSALVFAAGQGVTVGDPAPSLEWLDLDGLPLALADLGPGPVLLSYFATF